MSKVEIILLDTNTMIRFLMDDHPEQAEAATALFEAAEQGSLAIHINPITIGDCCNTLESDIALSRSSGHTIATSRIGIVGATASMSTNDI